jgi:hypothetical protein
MNYLAPPDDTPLGRLTRDLFANNWHNAQQGILSLTRRVRVVPEPSPWPCQFRFRIDRPYKRNASAESPVELHPGPIRGTIIYRTDLLVADGEPGIAVALDLDQAFFHPNVSRRHGLVCLGDLPDGPFELNDLIPHLYSILSYENRTPTHPLNVEASVYFTCHRDALEGLLPVEPLY